MALIRAQASTAQRVFHFLHQVKEQLRSPDLKILGPAPAPLARKANQHRMHLLIQCSSRKKLQTALTSLREWLTINKLGNGIRWNVDVDPMDLS